METDRPRQKKGSPCPKCGNPLRLRPDLIGTQVMCPKCNATFTVGKPSDERSSSGSPDDPYEPEVPLKPSSIVPLDEILDHIEPQASPRQIVHEPQAAFKDPSTAHDDEAELRTTAELARDVVYEADWSSATGELEAEAPHERPKDHQTDYLQLAKARGIVRPETPIYVPRWTFFSGVLTFPWRGPNLWRWTMMAFGLVVAGELFVPTVRLLTGGFSLGSIGLPILSMLSAVALLLSLSCASAFFLAAVDDTADGFEQVQDSTLGDWDQWFFSFFSLLGLWIVSGVLGYPLIFVHELGAAAIPIASVLLFPILLLSALECGSFLLPFSPPVLRSLSHQPLTWFGFYVLTTMLLAAWFVGTAVAFPYAPYLVTGLSAGIFAAVVLIYARLLGRVAWKITGGSTGKTRRGRSESAVFDKPGKRSKRRQTRRELPPDLDQAARYLADQPRDPRPR